MKRKFVYLTAAWALAVLTAANPAMADDSQLLSMVQSMQEQMKEMQRTIQQQNQKINQLESRPPQIQTAAGAVTESPSIPVPMSDADFKDKMDTYMGGADSSKWLKNLTFKGDVRLRYEGVSYAQGNASNPGYENRARFRLRYGLEKKFNPDMKVGFRLASGSGTNTDPTSTNQTLTGNFTDKNNWIDQVYGIYTPKWAQVGPVSKLELGAGKFANPFTRGSTDMIWDADVNPEGAYEMADMKLIDGEDFGLKSFLTAGQLILRETAHTTNTANSELYAFQAGLLPEIKVADMPLNFTNAFSFYNYSDYAHNSTFSQGANLAGGNPNVDGESTTLDANQFRVIEIYNALEFKPFSALPVFKPYFDWAMNTANNAPAASAGGEDQAWALGLKIGNPKVKGDWDIGYAYKYIEANSVVGAFNDSDFGHSDRRGSVFYLDYKLTDDLTLGATGFYINNLNHDTLTRDQAERRFFVDLVWTF